MALIERLVQRLVANTAAGTSLRRPDQRGGFVLDPILQGVLPLFKRLGPDIPSLSPAEARAAMNARVSLIELPLRDVEITELTVAGARGPRRALRFRPHGSTGGGPGMVWFHGGGFVMGSIEGSAGLCREFAASANIAVISVDYGLGPENPHPQGYEDCLAAFDDIAARSDELGVDPRRWAIGGDSAGANLATGVALARRGPSGPCFQLLLYPATDLRGGTASREALAEGYYLDGPLLDWFRLHHQADPLDPRCSPLLTADISGVAPAHVVTAGFDPLRDEGHAWADRLRREGRGCTTRCVGDLIHGFASFGGLVPRAKVEIDAFTAVLRRALHGERVHDDPLPVAVIGAGSSGIAAAQALWERGIEATTFESSDRIGGNWAFQNKNGMSSAYRSLHINTSRERMAYADYPMPASLPTYPHHSEIVRYFEAYVDRFGFRHTIRFETPVQRVRPEAGAWALDAGGETRRFRAVIVANGHHWAERWPDPPDPGVFSGIRFHSHRYVDPTEPHDLRGKRVVVVGLGNSAVDLATELSKRGVAAQVFLSARRGAHVLPHYLLGRPTDQAVELIPRWLPHRAKAAVLDAVHAIAVGPMDRYGLPKPEHSLLSAHPTMSSEILPAIGRGDVVPKPAIAGFEGELVRFVDGTAVPADAVIYCTGYKVEFPFFEADFLGAPDNELPLWRRMVHPDHPGLFFVGLLQPLGAIMPLAEAQSKLIAAVVGGDVALPRPEILRAEMEAEREAVRSRYVASPRHTMQVDFDEFLARIHAEIVRGWTR